MNVLTAIRERVLCWVGHVARMDYLEIATNGGYEFLRMRTSGDEWWRRVASSGGEWRLVEWPRMMTNGGFQWRRMTGGFDGTPNGGHKRALTWRVPLVCWLRCVSAQIVRLFV